MKTNRILIAALLGATFIATSAFACPEKKSCCANPKPVPVHVVKPDGLPPSFEYATVYLEIKLDEQGVPQRVASTHWLPRQAKTSIETAVAQWRFSPLTRNGRPVAGRVLLPLNLVPES